MWFERIKERIAVKLVMAFHTDFQGDVRGRARNAEDHIAVADLPVVERHLTALVDLTRGEFGGTGDAAPIFTAIRQIVALAAQLLQQRTAGIDRIGRPVAVGEGDDMRAHSQISLVQSPPG